MDKVIAIDLATDESRIASIGHRNSQGIAVDSLGRVWSVEHGPKGGDELNLIEEGQNYGWPIETAGLQYDVYVADTLGNEPYGTENVWPSMDPGQRTSDRFRRAALDLPPRAVPHPMLVPAPVESREGRASSGTRATA